MQLVSFRLGADVRLGALSNGEVIDLAAAFEALQAHDGPGSQPAAAADMPSDIVTFLERGDRSAAAAEQVLAFVEDDARAAPHARFPLGDVELAPPVPRPPKFICVGRNYVEHAREVGTQLSPVPILFPRFSRSLVGHGEAVVRPTVSDQFDWEGELAVVIGRPGRHIKRADAYEHVAGYSLFNDVSVRDYQFRTTQYLAGKNFDASGPFGPALVTKDEIPDPHALELTVSINGEVVQSASTGDMVFDIPYIVEHLSEWITLEAGDVIATGTPSGVGFTRDPVRFLVPGDVVSVSIPEIGTLKNSVVQEVLV